ncbi:plasma membrane fusion protein prm1 [Aspergillus nanangensis]|uniref:Plasma membrane fusion protein PRM1 n=1 Tax=Aspergillus nanangensis TaxID=2582783 RepID=A0AAD4CK42_ASPNN|nr:plasma membrane fusion protein prm1 [Aspergillus nanangensis]
MLFSRPGRSIFPLLPPYGAHDPNGGRRIIPLNPDGITPYLGLRSRLSQVWLNRWTILLLLVLARVLIAVAGMNSDMSSAKREALSACTTVESMGSSMASMPHYLSQGVNEVTATGIEKSVSALKTMLLLTITGVEELIIFFIKVMYQTYLCLFTMVVRGSAHLALSVVKDATDFLNSTVKTIGEDIGKVVDAFEVPYNKFIDKINGAAEGFGLDPPKLDLSDKIDELDHLSLPSSIDDTINKLNNSIPTFEEVDKYVTDILRTPFEEVKKLVNESMGSYKFDRSTLPVPAKEQLTFCDDNNGINSFFNKVADITTTARTIFIAVLVIAAVLVCVPVGWQEIRRWRAMKERSQLVHKDAHDPMDVVYIVSRPYTAAAGVKAASRFSNSRRQILVRWVIAYATSPAALFVLCLAIAGLFCCLCQFLLLRAVEKTVPQLTSEVGEFADKVVFKLQDTSAQWAHDANGAIGDMDSDLNDNVLSWVNKSTTAVNDTLDAFVEKTTGVLNETFGGTILNDPIQEVYNCLIGLKVASIQRALTWVHDHAHIDFPLLPNDTFSRGASESISGDNSNASDSFLADAGDETSNKITEVVFRVIDKIDEGIRIETIISLFILLVWVINALIGVIRALSLFWTRERNRGEGGGVPATSGQTDPNGFIDIPLTAIPDTTARSQPAPRYEAATKGGTGQVVVSGGDSSYEDEKLGFVGQRVRTVDNVSDFRGSSYLEYGTEKR